MASCFLCSSESRAFLELIPGSQFHAFRISLLCRLDELNLSWCYDFTEKHVQVAVAHVSETITQLNLSGYRKNLQRSGKPLRALDPARQRGPQQVGFLGERL